MLQMSVRCFVFCVAARLLSPLQVVHAQDLQVPSIFGDHMVLQRDIENRVWGKAAPGSNLTVSIAEQNHTAQANPAGEWEVRLAPMPAGGPFDLAIKGGSEKTIKDVLIGEVWICSGQSNMEWSVANSENFELERVAANHPMIRMINFPNTGTQEPVWTHDNAWKVCSPDTIGDFSAVGYFFGKQLHHSVGVPIGLVNNSWGGSACEGWINRQRLAQDQRFTVLMQRWEGLEKRFAELQAKTDRADNENVELENLTRMMSGNQRPGNLYNGILKSHIGYGIRGCIWYQGESNAARAAEYRDLFPFMIQTWREEWGQGDFPYYWVQLADYRDETNVPVQSEWAELRESQTATLSLPNTAEAVIIDIGEGKDIHPRNKATVGGRLARAALANVYGMPIAFRSPIYKSMEVQGNKAILTFDHVEGWRPFDINAPLGFTVAGEDKKFYNATATILPDKRIEISAAEVATPVAVRYAWADNPVVNLYSNKDLPLTPFRTDDWPRQ